MSPTPDLSRARDLLLQRRYAEAIEAAYSLSPTLEARFVLADALRAIGRAEESADLYRALADGTGREAEVALYALARVYLTLPRADATHLALGAAEEHRRRFPGGALARAMLMTHHAALLRTGRRCEARQAVDDYLAHFPPEARREEARGLRRLLRLPPPGASEPSRLTARRPVPDRAAAASVLAGARHPSPFPGS